MNLKSGGGGDRERKRKSNIYLSHRNRSVALTFMVKKENGDRIVWKAMHFTLTCTHIGGACINIRSVYDLCLYAKMALYDGDDDEDSANDSKIMKSRYGQHSTLTHSV